MKISFDIQPLLNTTKSGVGFCEDGLIKAMIKSYPEHQYYLEYFSWKNRREKNHTARKYQISKTVNRNECKWFSGTWYRISWWLIPLPYMLFFGKKSDLTHFFNFCIPPGVHGKTVVTVHDMAIKRYPETIRRKTKIMLFLNLKCSLCRADAIVAVSEFTKKEILRYYPNLSDKIYVVSNGIETKRFRSDYTLEEIAEVKKKYQIKGEYFLYTGTLEPRKNLVRLIQAYFKARQQSGKKAFPCLVLAGAKGWMYQDIFDLIASYKEKKAVIVTDYLPDSDVPVLMCGANLFCFVSLYEGFGMPVLEAMACGTPVLTSADSAMSEISAGAAWEVNPKSVDSITEGILQLYQDKTIRKEAIQKGLERAKRYTWEAMAEKLLDVYRNVIGGEEEKGETNKGNIRLQTDDFQFSKKRFKRKI